ncbi:CvpA family protein [Clostridiisalibacter paucivorans]|uniref:CvpA family protein n=1 Tax=Clostridiisalibacter paucivorans TaxID=408753 RepID=UPI00047ACC9B|nr:CvpA family protein [Clostridiisalibacter paucivorans]
MDLTVIDIIIVGIVTINGIMGAMHGLILSVFNFLGIIFSLYLTKLYYPIVSKYIYKNPPMYGPIKEFVDKRLVSITPEIGNGQGLDAVVEILKIPRITGLETQANEFIGAGGEVISNTITNFIINMISIIIVFITIKFLIYLLMKALDTIAKLPVLKQFNKVTGFLFGIVKGIIVVYIIFAILTPIVSIFPEQDMANLIYRSNLGYFFYDNNIIIKFLEVNGFIG